MKLKIKKDQTIGSAIVIGWVTAILITFLLSLGLTSLVLKGSLKAESSGFVVFLIRSLSTLLGCLLAGRIYADKMIPVISGVLIIYLITLIGIGITVFDGSFQSFITGLLSVVIGGMLALILRVLPKKKGSYKVPRIK